MMASAPVVCPWPDGGVARSAQIRAYCAENAFGGHTLAIPFTASSTGWAHTSGGLRYGRLECIFLSDTGRIPHLVQTFNGKTTFWKAFKREKMKRTNRVNGIVVKPLGRQCRSQTQI